MRVGPRIIGGLAVITVLGAVLGSTVLTPGSPPSGTTTTSPGSGLANAWVLSAGGPCVRSSTPISITTAIANNWGCSSLTAANSLVVAAGDNGDTIRVQCGSYGAQTIAPQAAEASFTQNVTIDSETGALGCAKFHSTNVAAAIQLNSSSVTLTHLQRDDSSTCTSTGYSYNASNVYVPPLCDTIAVNSGACSTPDTTGDVIDSVDFAFFSSTSSQVTVQNSNFGPSWDDHGIIHSKSAACATRPSVTWTNNTVRDHYNTPEYKAGCPNNPGGVGLGCPASSQHQGCGPTLNGTLNTVEDRSRFYNCEDTGQLIKPDSVGNLPNTNLTIENSFFGAPAGGSCPVSCKLDINSTGSALVDQPNMHIYNNTFNGSMISLGGGSDTTCTGCQFRGNIFDAVSGTFGAPWAVDHNWTDQAFTCSGTCSSNNTSFVFASNIGSDGYHLIGGAPVFHGLPSGLSWPPLIDIDGDIRSSTPSPGADEGTTGGSDTTAPTVSITSPANGARVSASITVQASAADNVGVAGVQFKLDGNTLGAEDTSAPYQITWDTATATDGSHTLTAVARDAAGNTTTSSSVSVTTANSSTTGASLATCSGGTCTPGTQPDNSPATNFVTLPSCESGGTCNFGYYVPMGLQGTAAVVMVGGGGGNCASYPNANWSTGTDTGWSPVMDAHRYLGIELRCPIASSWDHDEDAQPAASSASSDTVYIKAVHDYVCTHTFNGVVPDCTRMYWTGGSSGGHEARAVMCSSNTVGLFRAVAIISAGSYTNDGGTTGSCFSKSNRNIFAMYMGGTSTSDPYLDRLDLNIMGFDKTNTWQASYFGCSATPSSTNATVGGHTITTSNYSGCNFGTSPQFQSVFCNGCGHSYPGLDTSTGIQGWAADKAATFFDGTTN